MTEATLNIHLSQYEIDYLCKANFLESYHLSVLRGAERGNDAKAILKISRDVAEDFRDTFTIQLAKVGFDEEYEVTPDGRILEDLIDRFYVETR